MFFEQPMGDERAERFEAWKYGLMGVLGCATIVFGLYWAPNYAFANRSLNFFTGWSSSGGRANPASRPMLFEHDRAIAV